MFGDIFFSSIVSATNLHRTFHGIQPAIRYGIYHDVDDHFIHCFLVCLPCASFERPIVGFSASLCTLYYQPQASLSPLAVSYLFIWSRSPSLLDWLLLPGFWAFLCSEAVGFCYPWALRSQEEKNGCRKRKSNRMTGRGGEL